MKSTIKVLTVIACLWVFPGNAYSIFNSFIDARVATYNVISNDSNVKVAKGRFTAGTGAGQRLLYGFPNAISTSHTTIKIDAPGNTLLIFGSDAGVFTSAPVTYTVYDASNNSMNTCAWSVTIAGKNMAVTQEIKIITNPRTSANKDTLRFKYTVTNPNTFNAYAGVRMLFDTQLGLNDNSPMTVAGSGRVTQETKWTGASVPESWISVDNAENPQIKAEGYIKGPGATVPDQLIIGHWDNMKEGASLWDYAVSPSGISDTAVAIFWFPVTITANGGTAEFITYYGLPDYSGAELSVTKTVDAATAAYDDVLSYNISYSNTGDMGLSNLYIWDTIPWNASFLDASPGYNTSTASGLVFWPFGPSVIPPGGPFEVWFRVSLTAHTGLTVENRAASSYTDSYWNDLEVKNSNKAVTDILTATITPTHTITPTYTITPTHTVTPTVTITPTVTNTPVPLVMEFTGVFPNPADKDVNFIVKLSRNADVTVRVFTVSGENVVVISKLCGTGQNAVLWNGENSGGERAAAGVYLYIIEAVTERNEKMTARGKFALLN